MAKPFGFTPLTAPMTLAPSTITWKKCFWPRSIWIFLPHSPGANFSGMGLKVSNRINAPSAIGRESRCTRKLRPTQRKFLPVTSCHYHRGRGYVHVLTLVRLSMLRNVKPNLPVDRADRCGDQYYGYRSAQMAGYDVHAIKIRTIDFLHRDADNSRQKSGHHALTHWIQRATSA